MAAVPQRLGKYPITGVLGQGAMGVVYKAHDPVIERPVAIKTIHKDLLHADLSGSSTAARFRNEARAVGRLAHPGIVAIYEYGEDADTAFIAMEYVEGRTLAQILAVTTRLPEPDVLTLMDQLLDALACAHAAGVWHRDIKPANLIVTDAGQLKVTDFGIARIESAALTQVTSTIGTPGYMAPEQYIGDDIDHRADLFACGVLLYHLLSGERPFRGTPESVMYQVLNQPALPPSRIPGLDVPAFYDTVLERALAKAATQRYSSATEFRAALSRRRVEGLDGRAETTVIVRAPGPGRPASTPAAAPFAPTTPATQPSATPHAAAPGTTPPATSPPATTIPGWDDATLLQVERALASFVGPVARVLVRQAARQCHGLVQLTGAVGAHLPTDADRQRFIARLQATGTCSQATPATGPNPTGAPSSVSGTAPTASPATADIDPPLTPAFLTAAERLLASHIGPIAKVVVKKAAAKTSGRRAFSRLLAEEVDGPARTQLLEALARIDPR